MILALRDLCDMLTSVFPNEECTRHMYVQRADDASLWNFYTYVKKLKKLTWNSFSFIPVKFRENKSWYHGKNNSIISHKM